MAGLRCCILNSQCLTSNSIINSARRPDRYDQSFKIYKYLDDLIRLTFKTCVLYFLTLSVTFCSQLNHAEHYLLLHEKGLFY